MRRPHFRTAALISAMAIALGLGVGVAPSSADAAALTAAVPTVAAPAATTPGASAVVESGQLALTGNVSVHDPTMAYDGASGLYIVAASHNSIRTAPTMNGP